MSKALFAELPLFVDQINILQPWLLTNQASYNQWKTFPRSQLEPLVWVQLRILCMPAPSQLIIWQTQSIVPSMVSSHPVAVKAAHDQDPPIVLLAFPFGNSIDYWLTSPHICII